MKHYLKNLVLQIYTLQVWVSDKFLIKEFIPLLEKSCTAENLSYPKNAYITTKVTNYSFDSKNLDSFSGANSKVQCYNTRLLLGSKNDDGDYSTKTLELNTNIDRLEVDSINMYEYEFNEYSYNERIFYMNQDFELWILNSIMFGRCLIYHILGKI